MTADWQIAIPSYDRPDAITQKTLAVLDTHAIPHDRITVYVADPTELDRYLATVPADIAVRISAPGLMPSRNHIHRQYPVGSYLVSLDDDITDVYAKDGEQGRAPINLSTILDDMTAGLDSTGLSLAGVYPVDNPFFMKNTITTDLKFIIGPWFITRITRDPWQDTTLTAKDDYERTIRHYLNSGGVLRYNMLGFKTRHRKNPGGLHDTRTQATETAEAIRLRDTYPDLVRLRTARDGNTEITLRSPR